MKYEWSEEKQIEIKETAELVELLKCDNLNRLQIWKELRRAGIDGLIVLEAFRKTGLFEG